MKGSSSAPILVAHQQQTTMHYALTSPTSALRRHGSAGAQFVTISSSEGDGPSQISHCHQERYRSQALYSTEKPLRDGLDCFLPGSVMLLKDAFSSER